ncbi:MAG: phosphatase PAP2 family protein [Succinivibrio sp.]|nr:phosphatase PAP2 family protein [Succinivibrio sp.]
MKKLKFAVLTAVFLSTSVFSAHNDVNTDPDRYYLSASDVADSFALLPPPPALDSITFLNDQAQYNKGVMLRNTERGKQASRDARIDAHGVAEAFSEAFGTTISKENTPQVYKLVSKMVEDAGDLATRSAKEHYMRVRPFAFFHTDTCNTTDQKKLSTNGSYPSGHTAIGWATALILAEINPDRQNEILKRGFELGQSRVICGYHWQSDVDAARVVAAAVVARLHAHDAFNVQLRFAKEEMKQKLGKK